MIMCVTEFLGLGLIAFALGACGLSAVAEPTLPAPAVSTQPAAAVNAEPPSRPAALPQTTGLITGAFVKEEVSVTGSYTLDPASGALNLSNDFNVQSGPDLFVVLSGASDLTVDYRAFGNLVTSSPKLVLGPLAGLSGAQTYTVSAGTDLSLYNTVVIWCESFAIAFAAAPLNR